MNNKIIVGVDEAGRGPLVGSVFAAAVVLPADYNLPGLNDSKKLSEAKRDQLAMLIKQQAVDYAIAFATEDEIFSLNILHATMLAMTRAIEQLSIKIEHILIDGNRVPKDLTHPAEAIIKGDGLIPAISAASILAKTARDSEMYQLDKLYPQYGFKQHKGYGTKQHLAAIDQYGIIKQHRRDFAPIRNWLINNQ